MKKVLFVFLSLICLMTGCTKVDQNSDLETTIDNVVALTIRESTTNYRTNKKIFYSYYLPKYIGRSNTSQASDILVMEGNSVIMSLNVNGIISDKYYGTTINVNENAIFSKAYSASTNSIPTFKFVVSIFEIDQQFYLNVRSKYFDYFTMLDYEDIPQVVQDIIRVLRNSTVNTSEVIAAYSNKEIINYQAQTYSMFQSTVGVNGTLAEMLTDYFRTYDISEDIEENASEDETGEFGPNKDLYVEEE